MKIGHRLVVALMVLYSCKLRTMAHDRSQPCDAPVILLFHGICSGPTVFNTMKDALERHFPEATVIALSSVRGYKSLWLPIKMQSRSCFSEARLKVRDLNKRPVILIGHSQGGLRAYDFLRRYKSLLPIKGLITIAAPWEGVPGARVNKYILNYALSSDVLEDIKVLADNLSYQDKALVDCLYKEMSKNQWLQWFYGAKDVICGSQFLKSVESSLKSENCPILAIAGGGGNFEDLAPGCRLDLPTLNKLYAYFVTGSIRAGEYDHDMWIPRYSAQALNFVSPERENFKRVYFKGLFHTWKVWSFIPVPREKQILLNQGVSDRIVEAIEQFLEQ